MPELRAHNIAVSLDGFAAGPAQCLQDPLGVGGTRLHEWVFATRTGRQMFGEDGGESGLDDDFLARGTAGIGATVMGRNMFGPIRGPWPDESWTGWWGDEPPYHHDVFVLTHHARRPLPLRGGTTFHFVTAGVQAAVRRAFEAAGGADVRLGGGAATIRDCMSAGLLDELHLAVVPILLGAGERLYDVAAFDGYECVEVAASRRVAHLRWRRSADQPC